MKETQASIVKWADETFGKATRSAAFERLEDEFDELKLDAEDMEWSLAKGECADVLITLYRLASALDIDLHAEVDAKMAINRARKWRSNGDGTGQHVREDER